MGFKQLIKHLLNSFLFIFSGIFIGLYVLMLFFGFKTYNFRDFTGMIVIAVATNLTQFLL